MNDSWAKTEQDTLKKLTKKWEAEGFKVTLDPRGSDLPKSFGNYHPDALLIKDDKKIAVEVIRKGQPHAKQKIQRLESLFKEQDDWRFEVVYSGEIVNVVKTASAKEINNGIERAKAILEIDVQASLLLTWASLEAVTRQLFPNKAARPQSPGRLIELLASSGAITPTEAALLRELTHKRNQIIHGDLETTVKREQVTEMQRITLFLTGSLA